MKLAKLFEPINTGPMGVKSRILMATVATRCDNPSGMVTERVIDSCGESAKDAAGMIIVEATAVVWPLG